MAIIQNRYVSTFVDELGLQKIFANEKSPLLTDNFSRGSGKFSIVSSQNGKTKLKFIESDWTLITLSKMVWRYGAFKFHYLMSAA